MEGHLIIKAMRLYLGLSQREVAEKLGLGLSFYQKHENIPGYIMRVDFERICKLLELLKLNPNKFFMERYELNEVGYEVVSKGTSGTPNKQQKRMFRECCPVVYIRGVDKTTGEKIVSNNLR